MNKQLSKRVEVLIFLLLLVVIAGFIVRLRGSSKAVNPELQHLAQTAYLERMGDLLMRFTLVKELLPYGTDGSHKDIGFNTFRTAAEESYKKAYKEASFLQGDKKSGRISCKLVMAGDVHSLDECLKLEPELGYLVDLFYINSDSKRKDIFSGKPEEIESITVEAEQAIRKYALLGYFETDLLASLYKLRGEAEKAKQIRIKAAKAALFRMITLGFIGIFIMVAFGTGIIILGYMVFKPNNLFPANKALTPYLSFTGGVFLLFLGFFIMLIPSFLSKLHFFEVSKIKDLTEGLEGKILIFELLYMLQVLLSIGGIWWYLRREGFGMRAIGFSIDNTKRILFIGIGGYTAMLPLVVAAAFIGKVLFPHELISSNPIVSVMLGDLAWEYRLLLGIMVAVCAPFLEEILFRGVLYRTLRTIFTSFLSIPLSACIFSILHADPLGFLPILVMGLCFAFITERSGSIVPGIIIHSLWNGGSFLVTSLIS